jgi:hypothetical protein
MLPGFALLTSKCIPFDVYTVDETEAILAQVYK